MTVRRCSSSVGLMYDLAGPRLDPHSSLIVARLLASTALRKLRTTASGLAGGRRTLWRPQARAANATMAARITREPCVVTAVIVKFNRSNVNGYRNVGKTTMRLYVNVDHVATLRQARRASEPDPVEAAALCERGGADGITVHLREDRRHIQDDDVQRLRVVIRSVLNLELATAPDIVALAAKLKPHQATFVPERREEITTEGGLDLGSHGGRPDPRLEHAIAQLKEAGIRISLFINPDLRTIDHAAALAVAAIELHTGEYSHTYQRSTAELERLQEAASHAKAAGLAVHAGHGLNYQNVRAVAAIPEIEELNIGHSIVSHALSVGMEQAVREMRAVIDGSPRTASVPGSR